jgi:hypothetical protein
MWHFRRRKSMCCASSPSPSSGAENVPLGSLRSDGQQFPGGNCACPCEGGRIFAARSYARGRLITPGKGGRSRPWDGESNLCGRTLSRTRVCSRLADLGAGPARSQGSCRGHHEESIDDALWYIPLKVLAPHASPSAERQNNATAENSPSDLSRRHIAVA